MTVAIVSFNEHIKSRDEERKEARTILAMLLHTEDLSLEGATIIEHFLDTYALHEENSYYTPQGGNNV